MADSWYQEQTVTGKFPDGRQLRVTLCTESGYESGLYSVYIQDGLEYLTEKYGDKGPEMVDDPKSPAPVRSEWRRINERAYMLSCLRLVEEAQPGGDFATIDRPQEWDGVAEFSRAIPGTLYAMWARTARELNPGLHVAAPGDSQIKGVSVTVA